VARDETGDGGARQAAAGEAWQALYRFVFEGEGQRRFHEACDVTGLAPGVLKALLVLTSERPTPMRDLAERFHCDPSYVTSLVDGLEGAGLAERRSHPSDRRVKMVALSVAGEAAQAQVHKVLGEPPTSFASLSVDELRRLHAIVIKLTEASSI
jgi:DNA-binding MarR family transcriptional regulator